MSKKKLIFAAGLCAVVGAVGVGIYINTKPEETNVVTKEMKVEYGNLVVGITESGSVTLGTVEQTLDVDLSGSSTSSSGSSESTSQSGSGMESQMGMGNMGGGASSSQSASTSSTSSSDATLEVQKVYVSDGQVVEKGAPLVKFTEESVAEVKEQLEDAVTSKQLSLKSAKIERKTQKIDAEYTYKENVTKGKTAKSDYNATLASLQSSVDEAQDAVDEAKERMTEIPKEIKTLQNKKKTQSKSSSGTVTAAQSNNSGMPQGQNNTSTTGQENNTSTSQKTITSSDDIDSQISALQSELSSVKKNYSSLVSRLSQAKNEQTTGKNTAKQTYDETMLNYENAKEIYNIAIDGLDDDVNDAQEELEEAKENLSAFKEAVQNQTIVSEYAGTILSVGCEEGDSLTSDTAIATFADAEQVNLTVSVSQEDISNVEVDDKVDIVFKAYEEETYEGIVTGIETSETSSSSSTVDYNVTVNVTGEVSKIFEGMTANVTFITKKLQNVTYVSNKAVQTEGTKSYVKKVEGDVISKVEITTGFSNGSSGEITEGLEKGDTVLIESQVSD